jgi:hypothetical protein
MHSAGMIDYVENQAAAVLRIRFLHELGGSEGVASYDPSSGGGKSPGWEAAQRRASTILDRNRTNRTRLADLMFSMCGVETGGDKVFDRDLAFIVVTAAIQVVDAPQLGQIGKRRSNYVAEKQSQAAGGTTIREALRRGAAHLGFLRLPAYSAEKSWRVTGMEIVK